MERPAAPPRIALLGNPNTGKTTVFNRLCGVLAKTANFPGTTTEARFGAFELPGVGPVEVVDLPGIYRLTLTVPESELCCAVLDGVPPYRAPDVVVAVVDASNPVRNLELVGELLAHRRPTVVALNMVDLAQRRGLTLDATKLGERLGCPVVPIVARKGTGFDQLLPAIATEIARTTAPTVRGPAPGDCLEDWAEKTIEDSLGGARAVGAPGDSLTERLDQAFTHPVVGILAFAAIMAGLFWTLFALASVPMDLIEATFEHLGGWVGRVMPAGAIRELVVDGVIGGVAGTVVFLPQICLLFFLISALEDTGYLARAAFVMDRVLCRFGLPGHAFVPLLTSHACAIPGILATKLIPDRRDRLTTILVAPLMSCSARLPVYVLLTSLLFAGRPLLAGLAFASCYLLGAAAALVSAFVLRRTRRELAGSSRPMMLELPSYKWPSFQNALWTAKDQGLDFLRTVGTVIMAISVVMWWLSAYPHSPPTREAEALRLEARALAPEAAAESLAQADYLDRKNAQAQSFAGRLGRLAEPAFAPLGYDWQLTVGVLTSFLAREVFVSTLAILLIGDPAAEVENEGVLEKIRTARRDDGSPVFTTATSASALVFFIFAMQCLATLMVTRRETGSWRWAGLQLGYLSALAWIAAFVTFQGLRLLGVS
jgi:ferrous iron transport protein B